MLPEELERYAGQFDTVPIGINPHETLRAMSDELFAFGNLSFRLGYEVLHNRTGVPFLTSDNPVCSYDPRVPIHARLPYDHNGEVELIFPLDAWTLLRGSTRLRPVNLVVRHRQLSDGRSVRRLNRTIAQFGYRLLLGMDRSSDDLVRHHADRVPTVAIEPRRKGKAVEIHWRHIFGPRPALSQFIDTPEKAARLEKEMAAEKDAAAPYDWQPALKELRHVVEAPPADDGPPLDNAS